MKPWLSGGCLVLAYVVVPIYVNWLRHRPHRLMVGTQPILLAGQLTQLVLAVAALIIWLVW